jgi:two-component system, chemotaxis family, protein-glutamate methylesterase/glutaminase
MSVAEKRLRIVAADDSAVMRHLLTRLFASAHPTAPPMELCATASDGIRCVEMVRALRPDVLLLDLEMPRMGGMEVLDVLHREFPSMPIVMCSAYTARGAAATLEALARGAADYVTKSSGNANPMTSLSDQLLPKIAALMENTHPATSAQYMPATLRPASIDVVGIGASTGGPAALETLLPRLPATFSAPVVIVQHMPKLFMSALVERLDRLCALRVRVAQHGSVLLPGTIWFAPGDSHMEVVKDARGIGRVVLLQGAPLHQCRPAVDHLFRSLAHAFGERALGVVLTGMGSDGLAGARAMVHAGGAVLAQDEASSVVWGMPGRVAEAGLAAAIIPLAALAHELIARTRHTRKDAASVPWIWKDAAYAAQ